MWTDENTLVAVGYVALVGVPLWLALYLERRRRLLKQIEEVRSRLVEEPKRPTYKTVIQMNSDGSLVSFKSLMLMHVGEAVTVDIASGKIQSYVPGARPIGLVVASEVVFE